MANVVKANPFIIKRKIKDDSGEKEYKFLNALNQLGLHKLLERVKAGTSTLSAKDLRDIQDMKARVAFDNLDESGMYFVSCNACMFTRTCSLFQAGAECKFNIKAGEIQTSKDVSNVLLALLRVESDRIQRALLIEKLDGSIDREVSLEILLFFELVEKLKTITSGEELIEIRVKGKGAISQIFGDLIKTQSDINVTPESSATESVGEVIVEEEEGVGKDKGV